MGHHQSVINVKAFLFPQIWVGCVCVWSTPSAGTPTFNSTPWRLHLWSQFYSPFLLITVHVLLVFVWFLLIWWKLLVFSCFSTSARFIQIKSRRISLTRCKRARERKPKHIQHFSDMMKMPTHLAFDFSGDYAMFVRCRCFFLLKIIMNREIKASSRYQSNNNRRRRRNVKEKTHTKRTKRFEILCDTNGWQWFMPQKSLCKVSVICGILNRGVCECMTSSRGDEDDDDDVEFEEFRFSFSLYANFALCLPLARPLALCEIFNGTLIMIVNHCMRLAFVMTKPETRLLQMAYFVSVHMEKSTRLNMISSESSSSSLS